MQVLTSHYIGGSPSVEDAVKATTVIRKEFKEAVSIVQILPSTVPGQLIFPPRSYGRKNPYSFGFQTAAVKDTT